MQNGIQHENGSYNVRLSLSKTLKEYMAHTYDIRAAYLYLKKSCFFKHGCHKTDKKYILRQMTEPAGSLLFMRWKMFCQKRTMDIICRLIWACIIL